MKKHYIKPTIQIDKNIINKLGDIREYINSQIILQFVEKKFGNNLEIQILVVGSYWGRDYWVLKNKGYKFVTNLDLKNTFNLPDFIEANVDTNFELPTQYDVIICAEVLEHLQNDFSALKQMREFLTDEGHIIISVPLYDEGGNYHIQSYSKNTFQSLLRATGFEEIEKFYRGYYGFLVWLIHKTYYFFNSRDIILYLFKTLNPLINLLGRQIGNFGVLILAKKSSKFDTVELNKIEFSSK